MIKESFGFIWFKEIRKIYKLKTRASTESFCLAHRNLQEKILSPVVIVGNYLKDGVVFPWKKKFRKRAIFQQVLVVAILHLAIL